MTTLKLTMMLGPRDTIEVCECGMPDMAGVLFAADVVEGWDATAVERVLMAAGPVFREAIMARKYEEPPPPPRVPPPPALPAGMATPMPALVRDTWGDPTPPERRAIEAEAPLLSFRVEVARSLAPEAWAEADASLKKADAVLAVVERRRAA
jgi:hypothetical protein